MACILRRYPKFLAGHFSELSLSTPGFYAKVPPEITASRQGPRQIEMAEMMVSANDFSAPYAEAILEATSGEMLVGNRGSRKMTSISKAEEARLREEMRNLEADFKAVEENYGDNFLKLTTARGYLKSLLSNAKVIRWLTQRHLEIAAELETIVASEAL